MNVETDIVEAPLNSSGAQQNVLSLSSHNHNQLQTSVKV